MYILFLGQWNIDALTRVLKAQPSIIRKHIGFWVSQGLLKELSTDEYILIQEQKLARKGTITSEISTIIALYDNPVGRWTYEWTYNILGRMLSLVMVSQVALHSI